MIIPIMETAATDPVKYPTVTLDGKTYPVKFRLSDMVNLEKNHQIDLFMPVQVSGVAALERVAKVLAAGLTHTGAGITHDQIMDAVDLGDFAIYALAVAEAQKKVSPEAQIALKTLLEMNGKPETKPSKSVN